MYGPYTGAAVQHCPKSPLQQITAFFLQWGIQAQSHLGADSNFLHSVLPQDFKLDTPENEAAYSELLAELKAEFPDHLPLLSMALRKLDGLSKERRQEQLKDIVAAADAVVAAIDTVALACFIAQKCPEEGKGRLGKI